MKIYLPHINYTVHTRVFKYHARVPNARAYVKRTDKNSCIIYLPKRTSSSDLAHELIHVLQYICTDRDMDFVQEQEHMGYIMHYLMGRIRGYEWV